MSVLYRFAAVFIALVSFLHSAFACPDGQSEVCVPLTRACACSPNIGGDVGRTAERWKNEMRGQVVGAPLEQFIIASHNTAINGAMPIPFHIRQALTGYATEDSMNRVRYKIQDNGALNLARLTEQFNGEVEAVTLIDVIVFRGPSEANNPALWAHELVHVDQYRDWNTRDFAIRYARNSNDVESPAYAKGNGYQAWRNANPMNVGMGGPPLGGPPIQMPIGMPPQQIAVPPGMGIFCITPMGRFGPGPANPLGSPCNVATPMGMAFGQVGF